MSGSDGVFVASKGLAGYYSTLPATNDNLVAVLFKVIETDDTLNNYTTLAGITGGSNTEANATNYVRKALASVALTADNTNNWQTADAADVTWTALGGGTNNTIVKFVICYNPDTVGNGSLGVGFEANLKPLTYHTFDVTTDGSDVTATIANFYKAA